MNLLLILWLTSSPRLYSQIRYVLPLIKRYYQARYCSPSLTLTDQDQSVYTFEDREDVLKMLRQHIMNNVIMYNTPRTSTVTQQGSDDMEVDDGDPDSKRDDRLRFKYYHQCKGIPQGSILSPLLCSYLYADLESHSLAELPGCDSKNPLMQYVSGTPSTSSNDSSHRNSNSSGSGNGSGVDPRSSWNYFSSQDCGSDQMNSLLDILRRTPPELPRSAHISATVASLHSSRKLTPLPPSISQDDLRNVLLPIGVLTRLIDDFLYITTSRDAANRFVAKMSQGFEEYGIHINHHKTKVSFSLDPTVSAQLRSIPDPTKTLTWCGFVFHTDTLEVSMDYSKYYNKVLEDDERGGISLSDMISRDHKNPGLNLSRKLKQTISWKCNPLVLDGTINSEFTVCLNVYQAFLFVAMKFHCLVKKSSLISRHSGRSKKSAQNNHSGYSQDNDSNGEGSSHVRSFLMSVITDVLEYMWITICARSLLIYSDEMKSHCTMTEERVYWLGLKAFETILQRKQTNYRACGLLQHIQQLLSTMPKKLCRTHSNCKQKHHHHHHHHQCPRRFDFSGMTSSTVNRLLQTVRHEHSKDMLERIRF